MKIKKRFIKGIVETASKETTQMPWTRGSRRTAFIAKRNAAQAHRKTA